MLSSAWREAHDRLGERGPQGTGCDALLLEWASVQQSLRSTLTARMHADGEAAPPARTGSEGACAWASPRADHGGVQRVRLQLQAERFGGTAVLRDLAVAARPATIPRLGLCKHHS